MRLLWPSQSKFAAHAKVPLSVLNQFFSKENDIRLKTLTAILEGLGINLEKVIEDHTNRIVGEDKTHKSQIGDDLVRLLEGIDKHHRKELINKAINLSKLKNKNKNLDLIERIERHNIH